MSWISVDIEADGPCPGLHSMWAIGAVVVEPGFTRRFRIFIEDLPGAGRDPGAEKAVGHVRDAARARGEAFLVPQVAMAAFTNWLNPLERRVFISDNNGFDWQFVNYYYHRFMGGNPFGHSSQNLGSLYKGLVKDSFKNFKHLRRTKHTHDPLDDALGNAEALLHMRDQMGLRITL